MLAVKINLDSPILLIFKTLRLIVLQRSPHWNDCQVPALSCDQDGTVQAKCSQYKQALAYGEPFI